MTVLLARNVTELSEQGVVGTSTAFGLDIAFIGEDESTLPCPLLSHLRQGELQGEVMVETVLPGQYRVPGMIVRQPWESKREAYERAQFMTEHFRRHLPDMNLVIPVVSDGQLSLWTKLGLVNPLKTSVEGTSIDVEEVIRYLYLGESNIHPGELAQLGYSLPGGGGEYRGIDILFTKRDEHGARPPRVINDILGEDLSKLKRGKGFSFVPVANVAGIVIMPDDWTVDQMKTHANSQQFYLNYHQYGPKVHLLYLTSRLFDAWKERGSVMANEEELTAFFEKNKETNGNGNGNGNGAHHDHKENQLYRPLARMMEYGYGVGKSANMYLDIWRPKAEIGGMKMILSEEGDNGIAYHVLDWGTSFNVIPEDMQGLTSQPGTADGLRSQLETGQLPMVPGLYYPDYLLATAKYFSALMYRSERPLVSFLRSELVKRIPQEQAATYLGEDAARRIYETGQKDVDLWYNGKDRLVAEVINTHAHVDHCGDMPYLSGPLFGRTMTIAHLQAMSAKSRSWRTQYDSWSQLTEPKEGSAYVREYRDMNAIHWDNQRVRSSINVSFEQHLVDHSLTGTAMTGIWRTDGGGGILYTADVKMGDHTRKAVHDLAGKFDRIIMETTNFDEGKISAGLNEEVVLNSLSKLFRERSNDTIVVVAPPNHLERLNVILEAAGSVNRNVALGHSHAQVINQMRIAKMQAPLDAEGFDIPMPQIGEDVALWVKPQINPQTYQKVLTERAASRRLGLVDQERLSAEGKKWVVVISPFDVMRHMFGGVYFAGLSVMHSAPFPYARQAQSRMGDNQKWIREQGGKYFKDFDIYGSGGLVTPSKNPYFLHISGHATFDQMVTQVISPLLDGQYKDKQLILVHGVNPVRYATAMRSRLGNPEGLEIIASLDRYKAADPFNFPGFRLNLD
jgi:hypothetical protein